MENSALREAALGNLTKAKQAAAEGLKLVPTSQGVEIEAALAAGPSGGRYRAHRIAGARFEQTPSSSIRKCNLFGCRQSRRNSRSTGSDPAAAIAAPAARPALPLEYGQIEFVLNLSCLYPTHSRPSVSGRRAGQGSRRRSSRRFSTAHSGIVWNCWTGALAHLGVARANALEVKTSSGRGCRRRPRSRCLPPTNTFLPSGRTPTLTFPFYERSQGRVREAAVAQLTLSASVIAF